MIKLIARKTFVIVSNIILINIFGILYTGVILYNVNNIEPQLGMMLSTIMAILTLSVFKNYMHRPRVLKIRPNRRVCRALRTVKFNTQQFMS